MKFPNTEGANLEGRQYQLPADFEGEYNLLLIAFEQWQQSEVDTWLPLAQRLQTERPDFCYYELPTISRGNPLFRLWLDSVMRWGIPDRSARAATITLYLDKPTFRAALNIPGETDIQVMLVRRGGEIIWRTAGRYSPAKEQDLLQTFSA